MKEIGDAHKGCRWSQSKAMTSKHRQNSCNIKAMLCAYVWSCWIWSAINELRTWQTAPRFTFSMMSGGCLIFCSHNCQWFEELTHILIGLKTYCLLCWHSTLSINNGGEPPHTIDIMLCLQYEQYEYHSYVKRECFKKRQSELCQHRICPNTCSTTGKHKHSQVRRFLIGDGICKWVDQICTLFRT